MNIKPTLPAKDEMIAKRYSRTDEDIAYKTIKLAALVNKFAHLTENQDLQNNLFVLKHDLMEEVIELSKNNPNISLKRKFDEEKMAMSIVIEIPGYNMIALHVLDGKISLNQKINNLEGTSVEIVQGSVILAPGVNKDLLMELKNMNEEERKKFLVDMEPDTFYKLAIRMGYISKNISSPEEREAFIETMISDKKIEELLKENEEIER